MPLLGDGAIRDRFVSHVETQRERLRFRVFAWVVMPEHVHLLIKPSLPAHPVPGVLRSIKEPVARSVLKAMREAESPWVRRVTRADGRSRFWLEGGGFDRNVRDMNELGNEAEYIHYNPVRRKLVNKATDWEWSSARWYAQNRENTVPVDPIQ